MDEYIRVLNAYTEDLTHLRYNLAHGLFDNIRNNIRHRDSLSFFEIGSIYGKNIAHEASVQELLSSQDSSVYGERRMIAGVCTPSSIQELRKELEILFVELIGYVPVLRQGSTGRPSFLHPGLTGHYSVADKTVATFGKIHPSIVENYEIPENTWYFEMDFETLHDLVQKKDLLFKKISVYQAIPRELNFILPENAETGLIAREIFALHPWITPVFIDSVYRDAEKIGSNKKSVNFSFTLQSMTGTINDTEAQEIQTLIIDTMAGK